MLSSIQLSQSGTRSSTARSEVRGHESRTAQRQSGVLGNVPVQQILQPNGGVRGRDSVTYIAGYAKRMIARKLCSPCAPRSSNYFAMSGWRIKRKTRWAMSVNITRWTSIPGLLPQAGQE